VIEIDVWSDIACPWCYLGKRRLAAGLAAAGAEAQVTWHAFELQPDMPPDGMPSHEFYDKKFGASGRWASTFAKMTALGAADGITFAFEKMQRAPSTRLAHRAIRIAHALEGPAAQDAVVEACFRAHFTDGVDISNREALLAALAGTPIDQGALRERLGWDESLDAVLADEEAACKIGISGVPFFVAQGKLAMSGAQPADVFAGFLEQARSI
jgi:predicted DsbA family dithiol-disulfide isomerase